MSNSSPKASVLLLTKNPGRIFVDVLSAVRSQVAPWPFEVLVIDSGSSDGTTAYCRQFDDVRLVEIAPTEFGHGKTRNLGIHLAKGEFVALLTHDAMPADGHWLARLVAACEQDPRIAGAFGRHLPYPDANPFVSRDIALHFDGFLSWPSALYLSDPERYRRDPGYRQVLHYFSDNNSCVRKTAWAHVPYPDVDYAEDQIWAKLIIEAGYGKAYADDARVYHSHNYSFMQTLQRSFDESRALNRHFGYRLCPDLRSAARQTWSCTFRDWSYLAASRSASLRWKLRAPALNLGRQLGYYLGQSGMKDSVVLSRLLSIDQALRRKGQIASAVRSHAAFLAGAFEHLLLESGFRSQRPSAAPALALEDRPDRPCSFTATTSETPEPDPAIAAPPPSQPPPAPCAKIDVIGFYDFVLSRPFRSARNDPPERNTVHWVIPDFGIGSGGHLNIFRFIYFLEQRGFKCSIAIVNGSQYETAAQARATIREHFFPLAAEVYIGREGWPPAWITVATEWRTAYAVRDYQSTMHRCYFVQDFETAFFSPGSEFVFAEQTYRMGFTGIVFGGWLYRLLTDKYGMDCIELGFSYDKSLYRRYPRREPGKKHVFFYARPPTVRRGLELGLLALREVHAAVPDAAFILAGWDMSGYELPFPFLNAGVVPISELADLYSQCDVALVLSFSNVSLLPVELMACGCVVVSNSGPNVQWLLNSSNSRVVAPTVEAVSGAIVDLLSDAGERRALAERAVGFASGTSWEAEGLKVVRLFESMSQGIPRKTKQSLLVHDVAS